MLIIYHYMVYSHCRCHSCVRYLHMEVIYEYSWCSVVVRQLRRWTVCDPVQMVSASTALFLSLAPSHHITKYYTVLYPILILSVRPIFMMFSHAWWSKTVSKWWRAVSWVTSISTLGADAIRSAGLPLVKIYSVTSLCLGWCSDWVGGGNVIIIRTLVSELWEQRACLLML